MSWRVPEALLQTNIIAKGTGTPVTINTALSTRALRDLWTRKSLNCIAKMPYYTKRGKKRSYTRKRRPYQKKKYTQRRSSSRRSYGSKRMSRKSVLNVTSRKKRDTMIGSNQAGASGSVAPGGVTLGVTPAAAGNVHTLLYCPTARVLADASTQPTVSKPASRTSQVCYMRGLSEMAEMYTNTGASWEWRRICFTTKGSFYNLPVYYNNSTVGYTRHQYQMTGSNSSADAANISYLYGDLFQGTIGVDWQNIMIAPTNKHLVSIKYDKLRKIQSPNTLGTSRRVKTWLPMNANLTYNDDEDGSNETSNAFSTTSREGMGDYFIVDFFKCLTPAGSSDTLRLETAASLYWHER